MTTESEDCSFTLTSDDEERRLSLTHSCKNLASECILIEKDLNSFTIPQTEPTINTTAHNDDDFLAELMKENQQLEAELAAATGRSDSLQKKVLSVQPEPCPALPPLQMDPIEDQINLSKQHSYTSPTTARTSFTKESRDEVLEKKCKSLQLRLMGAQKAIKNLEDANKSKDAIIAALTEELNSKENNHKISELEAILAKYKEENEELKRPKVQNDFQGKKEIEGYYSKQLKV